jgi:predicted nucleotidyltransferase
VADQLLVSSEESPWQPAVVKSSEVQEQIMVRGSLGAMLSELSVRARADTDIEALLKEGILREDEALLFYNRLAQFFETAEQSARLVLYFPFELIPPTTLHINNEQLSGAMQRFTTVFMKQWRAMLSVRDVRANFVDGDVLEVELRSGDLRRVVKAAHLIPMLVGKGLVSVDDVLRMATDSSDAVLQASVGDTLPVLHAFGYVKQELLAKYGLSIPDQVREPSPTPRSCKEIYDSFVHDEGVALVVPGDATAARRAWLEKQYTNQLIQHTGEQLALVFKTRATVDLTDEMLQSETFAQACVIGLRRACERIGAEHAQDAKDLFDSYAPLLSRLTQTLHKDSRDVVRGMFSSLVALRVLPADGRAENAPPTFTTSLVTNLERVHEDVRILREQALSIARHPYLSTKVFPVALLFGSQIKGYGLPTADVDIGIFVRPGTLLAERPAIQKALTHVFEHHKIQGKAVEFWLDAVGDEWRVHDSSNPDRMMADSSWTHVLCGAAWCGNRDTIKELQRRVLSRYTKAPHTNEEVNERARWLEEMERDFLQYRLLHRGYAQYAPPLTPSALLACPTIDGSSTFWDSGYRRTATEIFIRRVFLPSCSQA